MTEFKKKIILSNEEINKIVLDAGKVYLALAGKRATSEEKFNIGLEEHLIACQKCYGDDAIVTLKIRKEFGQIKVYIYNHGPSINPLDQDTLPDEGNFTEELLRRIGVSTKYEYNSRNGGYNILSFFAEKKPLKNKTIISILVAIALAFLMSFIMTRHPENVSDFIYNSVTLPFFNKLTAIMTTVSAWLVLFSVITGIGGIGDTSSVGKMGKTVLGEMGISYGIEGILFGIIAGLVYFNASATSGEGENPLSQIINLVLDIIPNNMVQPFVDDNSLQVIIIAIFVGFTILELGKRLDLIPKICFELSELSNRMMLIICKLLPVLVFLGMFNMLISGELSKVASVWKMVVLFFGICFIFVIGLSLRAHRITGIPISQMIKKQKDPFFITLTTSSQVAAMPENLRVFKEKLGIDSDFANFALPLCVVTFMPCGAVFLGLVGLSLSSIAGISIDLSLIIKVVVVSIIVAIAAPPIPGSAFAVMPIIFAACSVPSSMYPLAVVLGTVIGYLLPAFNCYCLQVKILISAYKLNLIDKEVMLTKE